MRFTDLTPREQDAFNAHCKQTGVVPAEIPSFMIAAIRAVIASADRTREPGAEYARGMEAAAKICEESQRHGAAAWAMTLSCIRAAIPALDKPREGT